MQMLLDLTRKAGFKAAIGAAVLAIAGLSVLFVATRKTVTVVVDGVSHQVVTHSLTVAGALRSAGFSPAPIDRVTPPLETSIKDGDRIALQQAYIVRVETGDEASSLYAVGTIPADILAQAGIRLFPADQVWVDGTRVAATGKDLGSKPSHVRVKRSTAIMVEVDGQRIQILSAAATLGEALWENGIQIAVSDQLDPPPETPFEKVEDATLHRSQTVSIEIDGELIQTQVVAKTVGEALAAAGVALVGLDYAVPGVDQPLPEDGPIKVTTVQELVLLESEAIPFGVEYRPDPGLEIDNFSLLETGAYGVQAKRIRVRWEGGEEVSREVEREWLARAAQTRVIGYGTKIEIRTLDTPDGPVQYWRAVEMHATSYSPCRSGVDECLPYTATGDIVQKGVAAVFLRWFSQMVYSQVYVPGYGMATILDNGAGGPWAKWIDLGYRDDDFVPWSQDLTVYFLTPVPENILWVLN